MTGHTFENRVASTKAGNIIDFDKSKIEMFHKALKDRAFLLSAESPDAYGYRADWAHFDFLLAILKIPAGISHLQLLRLFWAENWKYLKPLLDSYYTLSQAFKNIEADQHEVLKNYADQNLELKIYKEFMEKKVSTITKCDFHRFFKMKKEEIDKQIAEAVAREEAKKKPSEAPALEGQSPSSVIVDESADH